MYSSSSSSSSSMSGKSVEYYTKLNELTPNTNVALLAVIMGSLPIKMTKTKDYMTTVMLIDTTRRDPSHSFKINIFRRNREDIPITHFTEGNLLHIQPLHIQSYHNDVQGLSSTIHNATLCILKISDPSNPPQLFYSHRQSFPFRSEHLPYAYTLHRFYLEVTRKILPGSLLPASLPSSLRSDVFRAKPISSSRIPSSHSSLFSSHLTFRTLDAIGTEKSINLICQVLEARPFLRNGTILTITDFTQHSFPTNLCLENPGMYYLDDKVIEPQYLIDVLCWDEHNEVARTLKQGDFVILYAAYVSKSPKKIRLVLHGGEQGQHFKSALEVLQPTDTRLLSLRQRQPETAQEFVTSSFVGVPYTTHPSHLFRIRAQFASIPCPSTWFYTYCLARQEKVLFPHPLCAPEQHTVHAAFQCTLKTTHGLELHAVCKEQGILDFLGGHDLPARFAESSVLDPLIRRVQELSNSPIFCDITLQRIQEQDGKGQSVRYQIFGTYLHDAASA